MRSCDFLRDGKRGEGKEFGDFRAGGRARAAAPPRMPVIWPENSNDIVSSFLTKYAAGCSADSCDNDIHTKTNDLIHLHDGRDLLFVSRKTWDSYTELVGLIHAFR